MKQVLATLLCASAVVMWKDCKHEERFEKARQQRNKLIQAAGLSPSKYDCSHKGHGVTSKLDLNDLHCEVTWHLDDSKVRDDQHDDIGLFVPEGDTVHFVDPGKPFTVSVRSNPNDVPNPPANTQQEGGCDPSPLPQQPATPTDEYTWKAQQGGVTKECHYKLSFTFVDPKLKPIDPHISVGK